MTSRQAVHSMINHQKKITIETLKLYILGIFIIEQVQNVHGFLRNSFCIVITTVMTFMHIAIFINIVRLLKKIEIYLHTYFRYFQIGSISTSYPFPPSLTD